MNMENNNCNVVELIDTLLSETDTGKLEEADAQVKILNATQIHNYVASKVAAYCQAALTKETSANELVHLSLGIFYSTHSVETLNETLKSFKEVQRSYSKDNHRQVKLASDWVKGVKHGLGILVAHSATDKMGNTLYKIDQSKTCAELKDGAFTLRGGNDAFTAARNKYRLYQRHLDLVSPRLWVDYAEKNRLQGLTDLLKMYEQIGKKNLDERARKRNDESIAATRADIAEMAEQAQARAASNAEAIAAVAA